MNLTKVKLACRASQAVERLAATPIDPASLAAFRILFGLVMAGGALRFMALGWVDEFYVRPSFHFTWALSPGVRPLPEPLMHLHFAALALLALGIAIGFHYRLCAALFCLGFTYVELIDKTTYLNHYYLVSLLSGLLVFLPGHVEWSVDRWRRPSLAIRTVPAWTINVLRFQLAVVYVFAGAAKLNADWLFDAQPLRLWLAARSDLPVIGPLLSQLWVAYAFSWFGAAYDLTIVLFLLRQRTRVVAYLTVILFHVMTWILFPIGIFPWIMTVSTLVFFSPDWPRRFIRASPAAGRSAAAAPAMPGRAVRLALVAHVVIQLLVPLRAYWPGADPDWTGRGFNFAWRVMLVEKSGATQLFARNPSTGREWQVPILPDPCLPTGSFHCRRVEAI